MGVGERCPGWRTQPSERKESHMNHVMVKFQNSKDKRKYKWHPEYNKQVIITTKSHYPVAAVKIFHTLYGLGTDPSEWMLPEVASK